MAVRPIDANKLKKELAPYEENNFFQQIDVILKIVDIQPTLTALRPVSREQGEKVWRGCEKCRDQSNWPSWIEKGFVYCPKCGTPLTSWAWEKQVERLEALKDGL